MVVVVVVKYLLSTVYTDLPASLLICQGPTMWVTTAYCQHHTCLPYLNFLIDYYPRESEGLCFYQRWFVCLYVCLSVCLFVTTITK